MKTLSLNIPVPDFGEKDADAQALTLAMDLRHVSGNVTFTQNKVEAWFKVGAISYGYRSASQQSHLIMDGATAWAGLRGHDFHQRVTSRPYPAAKWRVAHELVTPKPNDRDQFDQLMVEVQKTMFTSTLSENEVYVSVTVGNRNTVNRLSQATRGRGKPLQRELSKLGAKLATVESTLSRQGLKARKATQDEVKWLTHRSVGLHLPEPFDTSAANNDQSVNPFDVPAFYSGLTIDPCPGKPYVKVTGSPFRNGQEVTRYVSVLSVARTEDIEIPERHEPWLARAEQLPFAVEWSIRGRILGGREAARHMAAKMKLIDDNMSQLRAHSLMADENTQRTDRRSRAVKDEMQHSTDVAASRFHGHIRAAVAGSTPDEVASRVTRFTEHYRDMNFDIAMDVLGQYDLFREFWPGEKLRIRSHKRHQPVSYFAAGMPHMAATVGDRQGTYLGYTVSTSRRAVMWDPHRAMRELEKSGMTPVVGAPGSGKSSFIEFMCVRAVERGIPTTAIDHSGPMARICYMPRFAGVAKHIDLLRAEPGTLSTYASILDPSKLQLRDDPQVITAIMQGANEEQVSKLVEDLYLDGLKESAMLRSQQARSMLSSLVPHTMRGDRDVLESIADAVRYVADQHNGETRLASLDEAVEFMLSSDSQRERQSVGRMLKDMSEYPQTRLFFGNLLRDGGEDRSLDDKLLVVMTAAGLTIPTSADESDWTIEEQVAIPLLAAANQYASKRIYSLPMAVPKLFAGDEVHVDRRHAAGKTLWTRLTRDSRKWRMRVLAGTQLAGDLLDLDAAGLTSEVFIGRMEDEADASAALKLARVPVGVGYEQEVLNLSPDRTAPYRDMIFADADGNVDKVRIDFRYDEELVNTIRVDPRAGLKVPDRFVKVAA